MEQFLILIFVLLKFSEVPAPLFQNPAYATGTNLESESEFVCLVDISRKKIHEVKQISPLPKSKREQKNFTMRQGIVKGREVFKSNDSRKKIQTRKYARIKWCFPAIGTYLGKINTRLIPLSRDHNAQSVSSGNLINY